MTKESSLSRLSSWKCDFHGFHGFHEINIVLQFKYPTHMISVKNNRKNFTKEVKLLRALMVKFFLYKKYIYILLYIKSKGLFGSFAYRMEYFLLKAECSNKEWTSGPFPVFFFLYLLLQRVCFIKYRKCICVHTLSYRILIFWMTKVTPKDGRNGRMSRWAWRKQYHREIWKSRVPFWVWHWQGCSNLSQWKEPPGFLQLDDSQP